MAWVSQGLRNTQKGTEMQLWLKDRRPSWLSPPSPTQLRENQKLKPRIQLWRGCLGSPRSQCSKGTQKRSQGQMSRGLWYKWDDGKPLDREQPYQLAHVHSRAHTHVYTHKHVHIQRDPPMHMSVRTYVYTHYPYKYSYMLCTRTYTERYTYVCMYHTYMQRCTLHIPHT